MRRNFRQDVPSKQCSDWQETTYSRSTQHITDSNLHSGVVTDGEVTITSPKFQPVKNVLFVGTFSNKNTTFWTEYILILAQFRGKIEISNTHRPRSSLSEICSSLSENGTFASHLPPFLTRNTADCRTVKVFPWTNHVLLTPEAEPVPLGRPHPVSYPVSKV